jgi:hypothetical protein
MYIRIGDAHLHISREIAILESLYLRNRIGCSFVTVASILQGLEYLRECNRRVWAVTPRVTLYGKRDISEYLIYIPVHISVSIYTTPTNVRYQQ